MSHAAGNYVKKLKTAPNGAPITTSERPLLWYLADGHNEEQGGFHFASVKTLAAHCGVGERQMRRVIASIERKGIVERIPLNRANGSQTVNRYVFPELGYICPACDAVVEPMAKHPCTETAKASRKATSKASKGINTRAENLKKTGGKTTKSGGKPEEKPVEVTFSPLSPTTSSPGTERQGPPVVGDTLPRSPATPLTTNTSTNPTTNEATNEAKADDPGSIDFDSQEKELPQLPREKHPRDMTLVEMRKPRPLHTVVAEVVPQTKWDEVKQDVQTQLMRLPERLCEAALATYDAGIKDSTLADEGCEGDTMNPTWTIYSPEPRKTQEALVTLSDNVKRALWKITRGLTVFLKVYGGGE